MLKNSYLFMEILYKQIFTLTIMEQFLSNCYIIPFQFFNVSLIFFAFLSSKNHQYQRIFVLHDFRKDKVNSKNVKKIANDIKKNLNLHITNSLDQFNES